MIIIRLEKITFVQIQMGRCVKYETLSSDAVVGLHNSQVIEMSVRLIPATLASLSTPYNHDLQHRPS